MSKMKIYKDTINVDLTRRPLIGKIIGRQNFVSKVRFPAVFSKVPHVQLCVEKMDTGCFIEPSPFTQNGQKIYHTVTRYDASVSNVTERGFTLTVSTWSSSVIYGFRISWMAIGEDDTASEIDKLFALHDLFVKYHSRGQSGGHGEDA